MRTHRLAVVWVDLADDLTDHAIVEAIISLARGLQLKTVAEGVETPTQAQLLKERGCDTAQGFLFSEALNPDALASFVGERKRKHRHLPELT